MKRLLCALGFVLCCAVPAFGQLIPAAPFVGTMSSGNATVNIPVSSSMGSCAFTATTGASFGGGTLTFYTSADGGQTKQTVSGNADSGNPSPTSTMTSAGKLTFTVASQTNFIIVLTGGTSPSIPYTVVCANTVPGGSAGSSTAVYPSPCPSNQGDGGCNVHVLNTPTPMPTSCPSGGTCGTDFYTVNDPIYFSKLLTYYSVSMTAGSTTYQLVAGSTTLNTYCPGVTVGGNAASTSVTPKTGTSSGSATAIGPQIQLAGGATNTVEVWGAPVASGQWGTAFEKTFWIYLPAGATATNLYLTTGSTAPTSTTVASAWCLQTNL